MLFSLFDAPSVFLFTYPFAWLFFFLRSSSMLISMLAMVASTLLSHGFLESVANFLVVLSGASLDFIL